MEDRLPDAGGPPAFVPTLTEVVPDHWAPASLATMAAPSGHRTPGDPNEAALAVWRDQLQDRLADALIRALSELPQTATWDAQALRQTAGDCLDRALQEALRSVGSNASRP